MSKRTTKAHRQNQATARLLDTARAQLLAQLPPVSAFGAGGGGEFSGESVGRPGQDRHWQPVARDARSDTIPGLKSQWAASRDLINTSPIALGAINTNVDRVVGTGLALSAQPHIGVLGWSADQAAEWKAKYVQPEFSMFADSPLCDIEETLTFYQQQSLVLRSTLGSGDCFTLLPDALEAHPDLPYMLRTQILEADRCGNPNAQQDTATMMAGVQLGKSGAPEKFFIYDQHPGAGFQWGFGSHAGEWVQRIGRSGRRRILHHFRKTRPGMPRGLPYLAPIVGCLKQISRYTEAEIMAAVISAYLTVFVTASPQGKLPPIFAGATDDGRAPAQEVALGMGAVVPLMPGEEAHVVNPNRPNPNFEPFILAVIKQIGMGLGLPYELLLKQFNSSYSASKAALLDAWVYFRGVRNWLSLSFCQPVYETWMTEAVGLGRIPAPGFFADPRLRWAYTRAAWHGDSMGSINPKDEVAAYAAAIDAGLITRERAEWELYGSDWNDTYGQKKAEHTRLKADGMLPTPKPGAAKAAAAPAEGVEA